MAEEKLEGQAPESSQEEGMSQEKTGVAEKKAMPEKLVPASDLDKLRSIKDREVAQAKKEAEEARQALAALQEQMAQQKELFEAKLKHLEEKMAGLLGEAQPALEEIRRASRLQQAIARYRQNWPEIPPEVFAECRTEDEVDAAAYKYLKQLVAERQKLEKEMAKATGTKRGLGYVSGGPLTGTAMPSDKDKLAKMREEVKTKGVDRGLAFSLATDPTLRKKEEEGTSTKI